MKLEFKDPIVFITHLITDKMNIIIFLEFMALIVNFLAIYYIYNLNCDNSEYKSRIEKLTNQTEELVSENADLKEKLSDINFTALVRDNDDYSVVLDEILIKSRY